MRLHRRVAYVSAGLGVAVAGTFIWLFLWHRPTELLFAQKLEQKDFLAADNRNRTSVLTAIGGLVGICGVLLSWRQLQANRPAALVNRELALNNQAAALKGERLAEQGQITGRFKDASLLLGHENLAVRVGAIASLG